MPGAPHVCLGVQRGLQQCVKGLLSPSGFISALFWLGHLGSTGTFTRLQGAGDLRLVREGGCWREEAREGNASAGLCKEVFCHLQ